MPARMDNYFLSEVLRHFWRGVGQFWGGGETVVHSFFVYVLGQFKERFG